MLNNAIDFGSNMDSKSNLESHLALLETVNQPRTNVHVSDSKPDRKTDAFWQEMIVIFFILDHCELFKFIQKREPNS